jgi:hypothetical protein
MTRALGPSPGGGPSSPTRSPSDRQRCHSEGVAGLPVGRWRRLDSPAVLQPIFKPGKSRRRFPFSAESSPFDVLNMIVHLRLPASTRVRYKITGRLAIGRDWIANCKERLRGLKLSGRRQHCSKGEAPCRGTWRSVVCPSSAFANSTQTQGSGLKKHMSYCFHIA